MDDEIPNGVWRIDESTRVALRLDAARRFAVKHEYEAAVLEVEELLDDSPAHPEALFLLGEASLELGQPEVALEAYTSALGAGADGVGTHVGLALAQFDLCKFDAAEASARRAVALASDNPEAHHVLGLTLERTPGREAEAVTHLTAAQRLDPERFPFPLRLRPVDWDRAYAKALQRVHPDVSEFWQTVPIRWEGFPDLAELILSQPVIRPTVGGLYLGEPPPVDDPWEVRPDALRLYTRNLARAPTREDAIDDLAAVLQTEALDWLGWDPEDLA